MVRFDIRIEHEIAIFFLFNRNTLNNRSKNGSVFKMAATVHERDN